jgi:hypothetical protein
VAGRDNFFDTPEELGKSLWEDLLWKEIRLDEFSEEQIQKLVGQFGFRGQIPAWVPARPLLLATLAARGLVSGTDGGLFETVDPAEGWDFLIQEVCKREAKIEKGISGDNIRRILESLATIARATPSGLGPLSPRDIETAFQEECGFAPTDEALVVLRRLPGLCRDTSVEEDARCFVDMEWADVCRSGDLVRYCADPYPEEGVRRLSSAKTPIGEVGISVASKKLAVQSFNGGKLAAAISAFGKHGGKAATFADLFSIQNVLSNAA